MANTRLDRILTHLARRHVPHLAATNVTGEARLRLLATGLAKNGVLVLMGVLPDELLVTKEAHINAWVSLYGSLYNLLTATLFPSLMPISATYADNLLPPVVVLEGAGSVVLAVFAGYIVPYVATRQSDAVISEAELRGVMTIVLDELEARDLPAARYNRLCSEGMALLQALLQSPVQTIPLTEFVRPIFQTLKTPTPPAPPPPPPDIPETDRLEHLKTQEMFVSKIPMFFKPPQKNGELDPKKPRPPVPPPAKPDKK